MVRARYRADRVNGVCGLCFTDTVYACSALMRKRIAIPDNENILLRPPLA